jgi:hypothetical protein
MRDERLRWPPFSTTTPHLMFQLQREETPDVIEARPKKLR